MPSPIDPDDVGRRFCDLVMKGGITSGVVFPTAITELSSQYRFRNIGGTSAGAIAAAATAAAEFRRANDLKDPAYGFTKLGKLPAYLGERPNGKASRLFTLFTPEPAARKHFAILGAMLNRGTITRRIIHGLFACVRRFPIAAIVGALPGLLLALASYAPDVVHAVASVIAALIALLGAALAAAVSAAISLARLLPRHDFGLVSGHTEESPRDRPALTDWLHTFLQDVAGKPEAQPLTFGDLDGVVLDKTSNIRGIKLEMMTTALTMGRPFSLPFATEQFYFKPEELRRYFPRSVVDWMVAHPGSRSRPNHARDAAMHEFGYAPLPTNATLPVIVAVRMSLSFPFLLSAIPLYRYAWEASDAESSDGTAASDVSQRYVEANVRRVLFSDGGICSNFPVHLFDAVLPGWPTFGINLRDDLPVDGEDEDRAYLPERGRSLAPEQYTVGDEGASAILMFASAIVRTMQNWRDNLQRAAPGFRDRVVTIRHTKREGGLNLDMAAADIHAMAASGDLGAHKLIAGFARPETLDDDRFTYHRWVRVRSLLTVLQQVLREIHDGVTVLDNHPPYPDLVRDAPAYVGSSYRLSETARKAAGELLDTLDALQHDLADEHVEYARTAPRPEVELRIQPVW
jgi:predicted acylesterase/phospholipase RssA